MTMYSEAKTSSLTKQTSKKVKRALTAYNIFTAFERERILRYGPDTLGPPATLEDVQRVCLEHKSKKRRLHRKCEGMIGFHELSKVIANRWKNLSKAERSLFEHQAMVEKLKRQALLSRLDKKVVMSTSSPDKSSSVDADPKDHADATLSTCNTAGILRSSPQQLSGTICKERCDAGPPQASHLFVAGALAKMASQVQNSLGISSKETEALAKNLLSAIASQESSKCIAIGVDKSKVQGGMKQPDAAVSLTPSCQDQSSTTDTVISYDDSMETEESMPMTDSTMSSAQCDTPLDPLLFLDGLDKEIASPRSLDNFNTSEFNNNLCEFPSSDKIVGNGSLEGTSDPLHFLEELDDEINELISSDETFSEKSSTHALNKSLNEFPLMDKMKVEGSGTMSDLKMDSSVSNLWECPVISNRQAGESIIMSDPIKENLCSVLPSDPVHSLDALDEDTADLISIEDSMPGESLDLLTSILVD